MLPGCYVEPAPIYGYLFINVIHIHFDQYCCLCLLHSSHVRTEKGIYILTELITGGQLYEQMRDQGIMEGTTRTCIICEFCIYHNTGIIKFPIWRDQTMQMYGKFEGFPFEWCIVLGWYYNDPCNGIIYCTSRFVHPSQERCRIRWVQWAGVMRSSLSPLWETPVVWVFFQFWQQALIFEL